MRIQVLWKVGYISITLILFVLLLLMTPHKFIYQMVDVSWKIVIKVKLVQIHEVYKTYFFQVQDFVAHADFTCWRDLHSYTWCSQICSRRFALDLWRTRRLNPLSFFCLASLILRPKLLYSIWTRKIWLLLRNIWLDYTMQNRPVITQY